MARSSIQVTRDSLKKAYPIHIIGRNSEFNETFKNDLDQINQRITNLAIHTELDKAVALLKKLNVKKAMVILSGSQEEEEEVLEKIHHLTAVDKIFLLVYQSINPKEWKDKWLKIHDIYTDMDRLCNEYQRTIESYNQTSLLVNDTTYSIESVYSDMSIDECKPPFIYTALLNHLLLRMPDNEQSRRTMIDFFREKMINHPTGSAWMDEFERDYSSDVPIWWYTKDTSFKRIITEAYENCDLFALIKMAPFIRDLYRQMKYLQDDYIKHEETNRMFVFHSRLMSRSELEQLQKFNNGFICFHTFLSCYKEKQMAIASTAAATTIANSQTDLIPIIFEICVNLRNNSLPVVDITGVSQLFVGEVLFSPHAVFCRTGIPIRNEQEETYQLYLTFSGKKYGCKSISPLLDQFTEEIVGFEDQESLAQLFIKAGYYNQATEIYRILLKQPSNDDDIARCQYYLEYIQDQMNHYRNTINAHSSHNENMDSPLNTVSSEQMQTYAKQLDFCRKTLPTNHPNFAIVYDHIGRLYYRMKCFDKSLWYHREALRIRQKSLLNHHIHLSDSYAAIADVYYELKDYHLYYHLIEQLKHHSSL